MSQRDPRLPLLDIRDHAMEAIALVEGRSRGDLDTDRMLNLALVRLIEIVGEAARRVSPEIRWLSPHIPWSQIVGTRDRIVHGYDSIDFDRLWTVLTADLPQLVLNIGMLLESHPGQDA